MECKVLVVPTAPMQKNKTKVTCSCWSEFILFTHSATQSDQAEDIQYLLESMWFGFVALVDHTLLENSSEWKELRCMDEFRIQLQMEKNQMGGKKMLNTGFCVVALYECWSALHFIYSPGMWRSNYIYIYSC